MISKKQAKKTLIGYLAVISISFVFILLSMNCNAYAEYSYSVDRFEVVGNLPGYFSDEFDDGILDSVWEVYSPKVTESGGVATLSSTCAPFYANIKAYPCLSSRVLLNPAK